MISVCHVMPPAPMKRQNKQRDKDEQSSIPWLVPLRWFQTLLLGYKSILRLHTHSLKNYPDCWAAPLFHSNLLLYNSTVTHTDISQLMIKTEDSNCVCVGKDEPYMDMKGGAKVRTPSWISRGMKWC